jgi:HK97 family phage prohead protease
MGKPSARPTEHAPALPAGFQVRDAGGGTEVAFTGYASTFDAYDVTDWLGSYREQIIPGAFTKTLREQTVPLLLNHDVNRLLANTASGTSQLQEDVRGLRNDARLDRRQTSSNDVAIGLERGDYSAMSFAFSAVRDRWNQAYNDRKVDELRIYDTSIVTNPANPHTSAMLADAFRSALGREGRSLWLARTEPSVRQVLPAVLRSDRSRESDELLERALRALQTADEDVASRYGLHGRARTDMIARSLIDLRAGKVLSTANQALLQSALASLDEGAAHHANAATSHTAAANAINSVLASADGMSNGIPPGNGNPILPNDGAGPRSASRKLQRDREAELRQMHRDLEVSQPHQRSAAPTPDASSADMLEDDKLFGHVIAFEHRLGITPRGSRRDRFEFVQEIRKALAADGDEASQIVEKLCAPLDDAIRIHRPTAPRTSTALRSLDRQRAAVEYAKARR